MLELGQLGLGEDVEPAILGDPRLGALHLSLTLLSRCCQLGQVRI
jgi:hypothetical protein